MPKPTTSNIAGTAEHQGTADQERGDDGMTPFERALVEQFNRTQKPADQNAIIDSASQRAEAMVGANDGREGDGTDDGTADAATGDDGTGDTGDAAPEGEEDHQEGEGEGVEGEGQEGEEEGGEGEGGEQVTPPPTAEGEYEFDGRTVTDTTLSEALTVYDWAKSLTPEAVNAIQSVLSGTHVLVERTQLEAIQAGTGQSGQGEAGHARPTGAPDDEDDEVIDPAAHARLQQLEAELAEYRQTRITDDQEQARLAVIAGQHSFRDDHQLTDEDVERLSMTVVQMGILPGLAAQVNGNISAAMQRGLEMVYWNDPDMQNREMNLRLERERDEAAEKTKRRRKAGALAGSGGNVSRTTPPPTDPSSRRQAIADELRQSMNGGQNT